MIKSPEELKIVFFGTPDFAVASLQALVAAGMQVVAVVTAPDKPAGRGLQLQATPVKQFALIHEIPVLQPPKLKDPAFVAELQALNADLHIVVAFRMLPELVWNMPPMGTVNVHGSLLPQYRGAAPINRAIMDGVTETGVTTFRLKHEIDTGDILLSHKVPVTDSDTAGTVHDKLMIAGAQLLVTTVKGLAADTIREIPQAAIEGPLRHAPKLFKEDMRIDWSRNCEEIRNQVRGLSPYPAAFTLLNGKQAKIFEVHTEPGATGIDPGNWDTDQKTYLRFAAADGWVCIDALQLEGKKRMDTVDFLRGFRL